jgi:glucosamine 6-phosphate synthetase-like amidotransferase/phosphosugar isomerase protein
MCSILGIGFLKGHKLDDSQTVQEVLRGLFMACQPLGERATGVAFVNEKEINVIKHWLMASNFVNRTNEYAEAELAYLSMAGSDEVVVSPNQPLSVLGHCRYPTKGSEFNNENNHPIISGRIVGIHNGSISNDDELARILHLESVRKGVVDSEVIFALLDRYVSRDGSDLPMIEAIRRAYHLLMGSYACAVVDSYNPHSIWLFRNNRPCKILSFPEYGFVIWASRMEYILQATEKYDFGVPVEIDLPPNHGMEICLNRNRFHRFELAYPNKELRKKCTTV